ncbi:MAG: helix-turn-helix domain-containing protein [Chlamydiales bacterium]|nr:helix-turn-helix domain-containing protein [Chlamydiales bacterium]
MNPLSPNYFFNSPNTKRLFQNEEDSQKSTTRKSSQVAQAVLSSPFQSIEDRALSHSSDLADYLLSPSDIGLEDVSYYAQGSFSLDDISDDVPTGYKRLGSPIEEPPPKRLRLLEIEGSENPNPVSNEQQISSVLRPLDCEPQSIPQLDGFSQMVNTWEVLAPSRGEGWMGESSQPSFDSDEEFIQFIEKEMGQIEANGGLQESVGGNEKETDEEIEERLSLLETVATSSPIERSQIKKTEKFDDKTINLRDRFILNALYDSRGFSKYDDLIKELKKINVTITKRQIADTFQKFDLTTEKKRIATAQAKWPRFNTLPFPTEPRSEKSAPLRFKRDKVENPTTQRAVARLACENLELTPEQIAARLKEQGTVISKGSVYRILVTKELNTFEKRREAAKTLQIQDLDEEIERSSTFSGLRESVEQPQVQKQQTDDVYDEEKIDDDSRVVLNTMHEDVKLGHLKLYYKLQERNITHISSKKIEYILEKFDLSNRKKREAARDAGWPRFKTLPFP